MLVPNVFQIRQKTTEEIQSELSPGIRALKINPDAHEKKHSDSGKKNFPSQKNKDDENKFSSSDTVDTSSHETGPYAIYNRNGKVVRMKIS